MCVNLLSVTAKREVATHHPLVALRNVSLSAVGIYKYWFTCCL